MFYCLEEIIFLEVILVFYIIKYQFKYINNIERLLLAISLSSLSLIKEDTSLEIAIKYHFAFKDNLFSLIQFLILISFKFKLIFYKKYLSVLILVIIQIFLFKFSIVNIRRKIFHFYAFYLFYNQDIEFIKNNEIALLFFLIIGNSLFAKKILYKFLDKKDRNCMISHIYLLIGLLYPFYFLNKQEYVRLLITICIMDSTASLTGILFKRKKKSILGLISGQLFSYLFDYYFNRSVDYNYFIITGIIEYKFKLNDNLMLPFASVLYYKINNI